MNAKKKSTTLMLTEYLMDTKDCADVLHILRTYYFTSMSTYVHAIRRHWLDMNNPGEHYEADFTNLIMTFKDQPPVIQKLEAFHQMSLLQKYRKQQSLKVTPFTGCVECDEQLSRLRLLPQYVDDLKLTPEERSSYQKRAEESLKEKSSCVFKIDAAALIGKCIELLEDPESNVYDMAVALACVTGRRMVEIFKCGCFAPYKDEKYTALFSGQAKKRTEEHDAFTIPLLAPLDVVQEAMAKLRRQKPCDALTNVQINLRFSGSCNSAARRILGQDRHFHDARAIYAVTIYHTTMPHALSLNMLVSRVLGHSSMQQSLNYACVQITNVKKSLKHEFKYDA
jgi:hypothetical protein